MILFHLQNNVTTSLFVIIAMIVIAVCVAIASATEPKLQPKCVHCIFHVCDTDMDNVITPHEFVVAWTTAPDVMRHEITRRCHTPCQQVIQYYSLHKHTVVSKLRTETTTTELQSSPCSECLFEEVDKDHDKRLTPSEFATLTVNAEYSPKCQLICKKELRLRQRYMYNPSFTTITLVALFIVHVWHRFSRHRGAAALDTYVQEDLRQRALHYPPFLYLGRRPLDPGAARSNGRCRRNYILQGPKP